MAMAEYQFSDKIADEICALLIEGKSLAEICRMKEMPRYRAIFYRLLRDEKFANDYARAREAQADADADKIGDIAHQVLLGELDPSAAKVAIDAHKWTAGRRKPSVYGDKLELGGKIGLTVVITSDDADL